MTQLADEASTSAATKAAERISGKKCDKINDERALDVFYYVNVLDFKDITETNIQNNQQRTNSLLLKYNNQFKNNQENFSNQSNNFSNLNQNSKNNNGFVVCYPGMKDVPTWLKTLRLHKYTHMFQDMSYDQMMELDEKKLEARKVTKGARKKILQSLEKLRDRVPSLQAMAKSIDDRCDLSCCIVELRGMMNTPICSFNENYNIFEIYSVDQLSEKDLPGHLSFVAARIHEVLFKNGRINDLEDEYIMKLLQVYEKICANECFNDKQRQQALSWKKILRKVAVDRNLLSGGSGQVYVGYAGFKRQMPNRIPSHPSTRSSTTSPPESSCAISPPPQMPQSNSAPPVVLNMMSQFTNGFEQKIGTISSSDERMINKSRSSPDNICSNFDSHYKPKENKMPDQLRSYFDQDVPTVFSNLSIQSSPNIRSQPLPFPRSSTYICEQQQQKYPISSIPTSFSSDFHQMSSPSTNPQFHLYHGPSSDIATRFLSNSNSSVGSLGGSDRSSGAGSPTSTNVSFRQPSYSLPLFYQQYHHNMVR